MKILRSSLASVMDLMSSCYNGFVIDSQNRFNPVQFESSAEHISGEVKQQNTTKVTEVDNLPL